MEHIPKTGNSICKDLKVGKGLSSLRNKQHDQSVESLIRDEVGVALCLNDLLFTDSHFTKNAGSKERWHMGSLCSCENYQK